MKTIVTIVGARPQFIKAAAFSQVWRERPGGREILVHTGQHYDENMSDVFFHDLGIPAPDITLGIGSGPHGDQTGRMLGAIEAVLVDQCPGAVLVYGDTNSTLAGALAAAKLHIPVAHVEAGLRSYNRNMPEEINRVLTDHLSQLLLVPTRTAAGNLEREGLAGEAVHLVGDIMYDIACRARPLAEARSDLLARLDLSDRDYVLATIHRAENTDDLAVLERILGGLAEVGRRWPVVLPLHPRTRRMIAESGLSPAGIRPIDPVGYLDMLMLTRHARAVVTDSGGLQKEAYFHHVPCVTLRGETEWVELVQAGWNVLLDPRDGEGLGQRLVELLEGSPWTRADWSPLFGDGNAALACANLLDKLIAGTS